VCGECDCLPPHDGVDCLCDTTLECPCVEVGPGQEAQGDCCLLASLGALPGCDGERCGQCFCRPGRWEVLWVVR